MDSDLAATGLILISALLHATSSSLYRAEGDRFVRMIIGAMLSLVVMIPVAFFVPLPPTEVWYILIPSAAVIVTYQILITKTLQYGELSFTYPITRGTAPVFVVGLTLLFFDHELVWVEILGVLLVALGVLELAKRGFSAEDRPKNMGLAIVFSLLTAISIASYTLLDSMGVREVDNAFSYIAWLFILINVVLIAIAIKVRGKEFVGLVMQEKKLGFIGGVLGISSYVFALFALRLGSAVEVAALRETSIMFAIFIGYFFLGEGIGRRRLLAALLITIGAVTIKAF